MRAVNLLPSDLRGAAPKPARGGARPEPVQGIGAYVVLGALALCLAALAGYIVVNNGLKQRQADLETAKQRTAAATAKAAALKPYADFEALASARVETVRGLAAARFDWEQSLRDLSRAMPSDVKLQSLTGDIGLPGAGGTGSADPLRGSISAPAITLAGCASSQSGVARMLARVKAVDGVTRVALSKSEAGMVGAIGSGAVESPCGTENPPTFSAVVFFEGASSSAALAPQTSTSTSTVPVPTAIDQAPADASAPGATTSQQAGEAAPAAPGTAADPAAATPGAGTTTPTTTPGS